MEKHISHFNTINFPFILKTAVNTFFFNAGIEKLSLKKKMIQSLNNNKNSFPLYQILPLVVTSKHRLVSVEDSKNKIVIKSYQNECGILLSCLSVGESPPAGSRHSKKDAAVFQFL